MTEEAQPQSENNPAAGTPNPPAHPIHAGPVAAHSSAEGQKSSVAPYASGGAPYPMSGLPPAALPAATPGARHPAAVPPPPREAQRPPRRIESVPGTTFGVAYLEVPPVTSGLAIGALVAGVASVLVSLLVGCFGLTGAQAGWGAWAAGAFAVLGGLLGLAGIGLGLAGLRQIRRASPPPAIRFAGRGIAIAGLSCGGAGLGMTVIALVVALVLQVS